MRKVSTLLLTILAISLFASIGMITPASATKRTYFAIAPIFLDWDYGIIFSPPAIGGYGYPLDGASFVAYMYSETGEPSEETRICHYKILITCTDGSTLEWYWRVVWQKDPYYYVHPDAVGVCRGVLTLGTGALEGFHGKSYVEVTVYETIPDGGFPVPIEPENPELCWAWYHIDPSK